ncbi:unnamed protein product [Effrenium voratum]|uniref:Uncharacterized protein n=1 Tax=Effrenium voratum TaxID=2562239 RepID=A0AA36ICT7_9DINO|nr:unnamed protein product [Effrenium voratum]
MQPPAEEGDGSGAAAPITKLSRLALKDALLELEIAARKTRDASSSAVLQLFQSAEKRFGLEVEIPDPALRNLFQLHVLAVEELLAQVRSQALATLEAIELWSLPPLGRAAPALRVLSDCELGDDCAVGLEVAADLKEAERSVLQARDRCIGRLSAEVFAPMDQRLHTHEQIREALRQRRRLGKFADSARLAVATLRKGEVAETGLRSLSGMGGPLEEAEARLKEDMQRASQLDEQVLLQLMQLKNTSVDVVKVPWASLVQIQAEYFMAQQVAWAPLGEAFDDYGGLASVQIT